MQLTVEEVHLFYRLFSALLGYVNAKLDIVPERFSQSSEYTSLPPQTRAKVRDALYEHRELIDQFVAEDPAKLSAADLKTVASWKHALVGRFYVFRYLKSYTIFLSTANHPYKAYGVLGLVDAIEELIGPYLPVLCNTVLLPFQGRIIYDGLIVSYPVTFGGGFRRHLNEDYQEAKAAYGIITSLGEEPATRPEKPKQVRKRPEKVSLRVPGRSSANEAKTIADEVVKLTDAFCRKFLNEEYAQLCRKLAESLARKRPSPLLQGRLEPWAAGIVRTIGWVNFLHDPSQTPHMALLSIDEAFGIGTSTGAAKLKAIRTMLKIHQFDPKWSLPSRLEDNPMVWMLEVNGFMMDIREAPREVQLVAFEKGLIPYIPADRANQ